MEDVLEVYQRRHDPDRPIVCLDETTKQLIRETRVPVPAQPGQPARHDYEYERNGTAKVRISHIGARKRRLTAGASCRRNLGFLRLESLR